MARARQSEFWRVTVACLCATLAGCIGTGAELGEVPDEACTIFARKGSIQGRWTSTDYEGCALSVFGSQCTLDPEDYRITFTEGQCVIEPVDNDG